MTGNVAESCQYRLTPETQRRPNNGLNVEIGAPRFRCKLKSPDGRGLAWLLSGGNVLAYGVCTPFSCPPSSAESITGSLVEMKAGEQQEQDRKKE